jgi:flagellin
MLSIRTNVSSIDAQRNLYSTQQSLDSSLARLSSGYRITKAGDDAAGLGISVTLQAQVASLNQAARNANDGISLVQVAEGALNESSNIIVRLRELAMQSASDGVTDTQRAYIQTETDALLKEADRIAQGTMFNGVALLDASTPTLDFQIGTGSDANVDVISIDLSDADAQTAALGIDGLDLSTKDAAVAALAVLDDALANVSAIRADFGAAGNRLTSAVTTIQIAAEALSAANSRIRDVNVAEETSSLARSQVLMQAGVSVLAQSNQMPQYALKLISG